MKHFDDPVLQAMASRRSVSKVGPDTPSDEEIARLLAAVTPVADHKALRPWRLILLRGDDRRVLGEALDAAAGVERAPGEVNDKPFRAELLIAVVARHVEHPKVPAWEQHATAAGAVTVVEWGAGLAEGLADHRLEIDIRRSAAVVAGDHADSRWVILRPVGERWSQVDLTALRTGSPRA